MNQLAQSGPVAADHSAEIAKLNDVARAGSLPTSRTVFTRALADILAGDAEDAGTRQASLMLGQAALRRLINETPVEPGNEGLRRTHGHGLASWPGGSRPRMGGAPARHGGWASSRAAHS